MANKKCGHHNFHWEEVEIDPRHPDDSPTKKMAAICDGCDEDITDLVGEFDPDVDLPEGEN